MTPVRVLLAGLPEMLENILSAHLAAESAIDVVVWTEGEGSLPAALKRHRPAVVITDGEWSELARALEVVSTTTEGLKLFAVDAPGRTACIYELAPLRRELGELSASLLRREILRSGGHRGNGRRARSEDVEGEPR